MQYYNYTETYYESLFTGWNRVSYPVISKLVRSTMEQYRPQQILDLGCGTGLYFDIFKNYTNNIYGIDASQQSVSLCKKKGYLHVELADATLLPFPDEFFDFVFTSEVLEHVENYVKMLKEINRVLKPKGVLLLTTTCYSTSIFQFLRLFKGNFRQFFKEVGLYFGGYKSKEKRDTFVRKWCFEILGGHYHGFRPKILKNDINSIGLKVLKIKNIYIIPPIQYYYSKQIYESAISRIKAHSLIKRMTMLLVSLTLFLTNLALKCFGIWANNIYLLAQKNC